MRVKIYSLFFLLLPHIVASGNSSSNGDGVIIGDLKTEDSPPVLTTTSHDEEIKIIDVPNDPVADEQEEEAPLSTSSSSRRHGRRIQQLGRVTPGRVVNDPYGKGKGKANKYGYATTTTTTATSTVYTTANMIQIPISTVGSPVMAPPTSMRFSLTGGTCPSSQNDQITSGEFRCTADVSSPMVFPVHVSITSPQGFTYVNGVVESLYDIIQVGTTTGQALTKYLIVEFTDSNGQQQYTRINTQQNIKLGDSFGALTLIEFTNPSQGIVRISFMSKWGLTNYIRSPDLLVTQSTVTGKGGGKGKGKGYNTGYTGGKGKGYSNGYGYGYGGKSAKGMTGTIVGGTTTLSTVGGLNIIGTTGRTTGVRPGMEGIVWVPADPNSFDLTLYLSIIGLPVYPDITGLPFLNIGSGLPIYYSVNGVPIYGLGVVPYPGAGAVPPGYVLVPHHSATGGLLNSVYYNTYTYPGNGFVQLPGGYIQGPGGLVQVPGGYIQNPPVPGTGYLTPVPGNGINYMSPGSGNMPNPAPGQNGSSPGSGSNAGNPFPDRGPKMTDNPTELSFKVTGDSCSSSRNTQGYYFSCTVDNQPINFPVHVTITSVDETQVYFSGIVQNKNDIIKIGDSVNKCADRMTVSIKTPDQTQLLQLFSFATDGKVDLFIKDTFGGFQFVQFKNAAQGEFFCCLNNSGGGPNPIPNIPANPPATPAPVMSPTKKPTHSPTKTPTISPTLFPTPLPTFPPTPAPTAAPTPCRGEQCIKRACQWQFEVLPDGDCNNSFNEQNSQFFICTLDNPISFPLLARVYNQEFSILFANQTVTNPYDVVAVGNENLCTHDMSVILSNVEGTKLYKVFTINTSCGTQPIYIGDRYAAFKVVEFITQEDNQKFEGCKGPQP